MAHAVKYRIYKFYNEIKTVNHQLSTLNYFSDKIIFSVNQLRVDNLQLTVF